MKKYLFLLIVSVLAVSLAAERKALIIGNSAYTDSPLKNTLNDVRAVDRTLRNLGFSTVLKTDLNLRAFDSAINAFVTSLKPIDEVVFYYSGHGAQIEGENFLIPVGKVFEGEEDVRYDAVSANKTTEKLGKAALSIVVLDACRDNPYKASKSGNKGLVPMTVKSSGQYVIYATA
ncbi:MAG: caspase family protein, partial [Candidatus Cloacimonetes bacterium]|nr:caspase family protein [Candidatus Cloacimonadota bacterium]